MVFKKLKAMDFRDEEKTKSELAQIKANINKLNTHFRIVNDSIEAAQKLVKTYNCANAGYPDNFSGKFIFDTMLKDLKTTLKEQNKRLDNLQTMYNLVSKAQENASVGGGDEGLRWCYDLGEIQSKEGKISVYTITIKESGFGLSENEEIVSIDSVDVLKRTIRIRKFQRFVPEVSVGPVFTFFKYNSYGTTSDSTGQHFVAAPTENSVRNLNISTIINFNYYIPNSPIHPLYQIGVGVNTGIPTLLTGFGLRSNINGVRRLSVSGGIAMTWIKELDKLKVGDKITGTSDIDKDLKPQFSWPPKPYIGLQYNF